MMIEKGVEMKGVNPFLKNVLKIIHLVLYSAGNHVVIIATKWGKDSFREAHEAGNAIDIKKPLKDAYTVLWELKRALGSNFIVRSLGDHLHIEFSPLDGEQLKERSMQDNPIREKD